MESKQVGLIEKLARVIFRQGDTPSSCYILAAGSVGVYIKEGNDEANSPRPGDQPTGQSPLDQMPSLLDDQGRTVYATAEGFSCFTEESRLGACVVTLNTGTIFGELALVNDAPRAASVKCLQDCDFLTLPAKNFRMVLRDFMDVGKASNVLRSVALFANLEAEQPGIAALLARSATFCTEVKDQVIMRQGDVGQSCFIITSGQVAVFASGLGRLDNLDGLQAQWQGAAGKSLADFRRSGKEQQEKDAREEHLRKGSHVPVVRMFQSTEGFSTFSEQSSFGNQTALLEKGSMFGELALVDKAIRKATIVCTQDTEFLVIRQQEYMEAIRKRLEKVRFFHEVVPFMKIKVGRGSITKHASFFFKEEQFPAGRPLLLEAVASKPLLFIVGSGATVELRRFTKPGVSPAYKLADRPLSAPTGETGYCHPRKRLERSVWVKDLMATADTVEEMDGMEGSIYCSMSALPVPDVEPFTAVARALVFA
ncbi:unnamed protein product [Polarella glacialis]|uniref:Cyclic nucleotide-binding domain-containing protein n=1 Tax=Polarella glacialis TaxID=89957 RepID=A0A813LH82_POLGL|nr:unnamed protein product [Polarella glacialis]